MKQLFNILVLLFIANVAVAQAPQGIPYQAVARNSSGAILASTAISVRFTIRDSIATGAIKYRETFSVTTSAQGMFSVNVGQGTPVTGTFAGINWATNAKFLQVEMDPAGGSSYIDMGTQQMMSVPYALNSGSLKMRVSAAGDTLFSGGGNFVIIPGISAANNPPYPGIIAGPSTVCAGSNITLTDSVSGGTWSSSNTSIATIGSAGIISGVSAGTTIISYEVSNSFGTSYATKVITVNPLPAAGTITGTATVCVGSTTTLSNTTTGGTWSSSATGVATIGSTGLVTGVATGTLTISYSVTNSCGNAVATQIVTVTPLPTAGTITGTATVTVGSTTTLSNATTGGTWSSSATGIATVGSTGVVTGVSAGTATISYTVTNGCGSAVATQAITVSTLTIGSSYGGGIVAYIFGPSDPGYVSGEIHGLIVAPTDQGTAPFGCYASNSSCIEGYMSAAYICFNLILSGYDDWYLPSHAQLQIIRSNLYLIGIGSFSTVRYWSSTQNNSFSAYSMSLSSGPSIYDIETKNLVRSVRAVRNF